MVCALEGRVAQPWWNPSVFHPILPLECRSEAKKTKVKKKTNNPQFDEVFYFEVGVSVAQTQSTPTPQGPWPKGPWPLLRRVPGCCPTPGVPPTRQREPPGAPSFPGQKGCLLLPAGPGFVLDAVRSALPERPRLWALAGWVWVFCSTQSPLSSRGRLVSPQIVRVSGVEAAHSNESPRLPLRTRTTSWLVGEGQAGTELPTTAPRCQPRSRSRGHCPPQRPPQVSVRVSLPPPWFTAQRGEGGAAVPVWRPCHRGSQSRVGAPPPGGSGRGFWSGAGRRVHGVLELQEAECQGGKLSGDFANELGGVGQDVRGVTGLFRLGPPKDGQRWPHRAAVEAWRHSLRAWVKNLCRPGMCSL